MADDIVWLTNQLALCKATDIKEILVDIGDLAFEIGLGNDQRVVVAGVLRRW